MHVMTKTVLLAAAMTLAAAGTAAAHVEAFVTTTSEGDEALVQFSIPHGCDGKPTTKIEVNFPAEVLAVRPVMAAGWSGSGGTSEASSSHEHAAGESHDMDSMGSDDGSHTVTWTADKPVAATELATVTAYMAVPDGVDELWMPAIQTCAGGATQEWTAKEDDAETPAPHIDLAAVSGSNDHADDDDADDAAEAVSDDDSQVENLAIIAIVLGAIGTLLGLVAIVRKGRKR